jgi:hypothetical protein
VRKWTDATTFSADYVSWDHAGMLMVGGPIWLQITDNGTNRICKFSRDGQNFVQIHSVGRTDFLTADQMLWGGYVLNNNGVGDSYITMLHWEQS